MRINDTSNKELSLYHDALSLLGIQETDTISFPFATFIRYANAWYRRFVFYIWKSSHTWQFDDTTMTTLPEATAILIDNQENYTIPSTALDVLEAYILNTNGDYIKLEKLNPNNLTIPRDELFQDKGIPTYWYLEGDQIILKPAPDTTKTTAVGGLKIIVDRDITAFVVGDTIKEPGILPAFHRLISLGSAFDFARSKDMQVKITTIKSDLDRMTGELEEYYSHRSRVDHPQIISRREETI